MFRGPSRTGTAGTGQFFFGQIIRSVTSNPDPGDPGFGILPDIASKTRLSHIGELHLGVLKDIYTRYLVKITTIIYNYPKPYYTDYPSRQTPSRPVSRIGWRDGSGWTSSYVESYNTSCSSTCFNWINWEDMSDFARILLLFYVRTLSYCWYFGTSIIVPNDALT